MICFQSQLRHSQPQAIQLTSVSIKQIKTAPVLTNPENCSKSKVKPCYSERTCVAHRRIPSSAFYTYRTPRDSAEKLFSLLALLTAVFVLPLPFPQSRPRNLCLLQTSSAGSLPLTRRAFLVVQILFPCHMATAHTLTCHFCLNRT